VLEGHSFDERVELQGPHDLRSPRTSRARAKHESSPKRAMVFAQRIADQEQENLGARVAPERQGVLYPPSGALTHCATRMNVPKPRATMITHHAIEALVENRTNRKEFMDLLDIS